MGAATPPSDKRADLEALATQLCTLRDLLVTLSLQLSDIQFESDPSLRAQAVLRTDLLLKACLSHCA